MTIGDRRKQFLPGTLAERFQEAVNDGELLALREDLGLVEVRLSQLMERAQVGEDPKKLKEVLSKLDVLDGYLLNNNFNSAKRSLEEIREILEERERDSAVWKEIMDMVEMRRKLAESESNRLVRMNQMISAEEAFGMIEALLSIVKQHVKEPNVYSAIAYGFAIRTGAAYSGLIETGGDEVQPERLGDVDPGQVLDP